MNTTHTNGAFAPGTSIFYRDKERMLDANDIRLHFVPLCDEAISALSSGTLVWIDLAPYSQDGTRAGFTKCLISDITKIDGGAYLHFGNSRIAHTRKYKKTICVVEDEAALKKLLTHYNDAAMRVGRA